MKKENLKTPAILLNFDALENNIKTYQKMCDDNGKELWPMIKTHKSMELFFYFDFRIILDYLFFAESLTF